jgi:hypothetical protein
MRRPQLLLDPQQLIVFGHPVGARRRAGLDLPQVEGTTRSAIVVSSVSPERAKHGPPSGLPAELHRLQSLRKRADLIELDQQRARPRSAMARRTRSGLRPAGRPHQLQPLPQPSLQHDPPLPIVLRQPILDGHDGVLIHPGGPEVHQLLRGELFALRAQQITSLLGLIELGGGRVQSQADLPPA